MNEPGEFRYLLTRDFSMLDPRTLLFVMLNPSTADERKDDPTIRRCIGFARSWFFGRLCVVNLFARRATHPEDLWKSPDRIVGFDNDAVIATQVKIQRANGDPIVAAWGSAGPVARHRAEMVLRDFGPFKCLGVTKDGSPRHPLYVKKDALLVDYKP